MKRTTVLRIALLLPCVWGRVESFFNIDTREPIIRLSPAGQNLSHFETYGEDFFGFAIALHRTEQILDGDGAQEAAAKTRIIVGAPMGTYPGGLPLEDPGEPALLQTGLIYSCSVTEDQCEGVVGDTDDFDVNNDTLNGAGRLFDHRQNARILTEFGTYIQAEQKIGQLLGATVYSRDGTLVVCAPAWTSTGPYDPNLTDPDPTRNFPIVSFSLPQGRYYTTDSNLENIEFLDPCNLRGEADVTIDQGYCTAGTDVDMLESGRFIIGTPGYSFGYGAVFYGRTQEDMMIRNSDTRGLGNILQPIPGGGLGHILDTSQGFQVTTGYITMSRENIDSPPNVLASVPRFDSTTYCGRVDVYDAREVGGNISQLLSVTAEGQQIAEHFGYALDAVDLNRDGYDDVVVGAPMYSKIDASSEVKVEIGRAYIFMNTGGNLSAVPIVLEGTAPRGRFGMSVLGIGDVDRDGFNDVAIGAPYEVVGNSTGVVYLYYGSNDEAVFRSQTPAMITSQSIADSLLNTNTLRTFGFSLAALDVDNNEYNGQVVNRIITGALHVHLMLMNKFSLFCSDLAIGTLDSGAVILLRSRPVVIVEVTLQSSIDEVVRSETDCTVGDTAYACFDITVDLIFSGFNVPDEIEVRVTLSEMKSKGEQRIFFDDDPEATTTTRSAVLDDTGSFTARVYLLNGITDSYSPLMLVAEVQQHEIAQQSSPGNGAPAINNLDFIIRQPPSATTMVYLPNNCGPERVCETDFALIFNHVQYLPDRGLNYETIEVGGVNEVRVQLILSNNGDEDAIVLLLNISHSVKDVFTDQMEITINSVSTQCRLNEICNIGELFPSQLQIVFVRMLVRSNAPMGNLETTFTLSSSVTRDTEPNNNVVMQEFTVESRADLTVSMFFPQDMTMYTQSDLEPEDLAQRSDVGGRVALEVRVSNVRNTTINRAELNIYYPASSDETGDFLYLLPHCDVTAQGGEITCDTSALANIDPLPCDNSGSRRRRHTVAPTVKQRRRRAREARAARRAGEGGLRCSKRQSEVSSLDCSTMQPACLLITCTISQLRGLSANEARITLGGFVDERFFFDKDVVYRLNAFATVTFNETAEGIIDQRERPDEASARITITPISPPSSTSSSTGGRGSLSVTIIVIIADIVGAILLIVVMAIILYCCGFFKRQRKPGEQGEEVEGTAPSAPSSDVKPPQEATT